MEGREDDYTFSEPYMLNEQVLVVKKDAGIKSWDDLAGKTVITQTDSAAQDVLEGDQKDLAATFATLDTIGEYNTAFMQLESGAVDAVACDLSIAQYQLAAKPDAYTQLDEPLSSEHYAVGFKKGDTKSADAVAESLKALYDDGTVKDLCDKYASYGLSFATGSQIATAPNLAAPTLLAYQSTLRRACRSQSWALCLFENKISRSVAAKEKVGCLFRS